MKANHLLPLTFQTVLYLYLNKQETKGGQHQTNINYKPVIPERPWGSSWCCQEHLLDHTVYELHKSPEIKCKLIDFYQHQMQSISVCIIGVNKCVRAHRREIWHIKITLTFQVTKDYHEAIFGMFRWLQTLDDGFWYMCFSPRSKRSMKPAAPPVQFTYSPMSPIPPGPR